MARSDAPGVVWENQKTDISSREEAPGKKSASSPVKLCQKHSQSDGKINLSYASDFSLLHQ